MSPCNKIRKGRFKVPSSRGDDNITTKWSGENNGTLKNGLLTQVKEPTKTSSFPLKGGQINSCQFLAKYSYLGIKCIEWMRPPEHF